MNEKKERLYMKGTASTVAEWDGPGMLPVAPKPEGSGQFDPCRVYEVLARILSQRGAECTLKGVRCTAEAAAAREDGA